MDEIKKEARRLIMDNFNVFVKNPNKIFEIENKFPGITPLEYSTSVTLHIIKLINELDDVLERIEKNKKILSEIEGKSIYFEELNNRIDNKFLSFHKEIISHNELSNIIPNSVLLIKDILELNETTLNDLESGKVKKIHLNYSADCIGWFQLNTNEIIENYSFEVEDIIKSVKTILNYVILENDSFSFQIIGNGWDENKPIYYGNYSVVQHQEISVKWFLKMVNENLDPDNKGETRFNKFYEFLDINYEFYAHGDEEGLIPNYEIFSKEEICLIHNGVTLNASGHEVKCGASFLEFINTDGYPIESIYLEY